MNLEKGVKVVVLLRSTCPAHQCASRRNCLPIQQHHSAVLVRGAFII